ncbi:MAG TPA: penicillin-binding protein activator, partial [Bacteroidota bacterium]|nr:penicillin-binding protein activator [Bacteroidota bacterium]
MLLAQKYASTGETRKVFQTLEGPLSRPAPSMYAAEMRSLEQNIHEVPKLTIGVLLSLMKHQTLNPVSSIATDILDGINFALSEAKNSIARVVSLSLDVRDTGRDSATTVELMRDFCDEADVAAVIGPLFSNLTTYCVPLDEQEHIPLITPTADGDNIAAMGKYIFQLSPDFVTRGKAMARFAVQDLGMSTLAVISSAEPEGKAISQSFTDEAKSLGATIVAVEFYNGGVTDMHDQFIDLRTAAFHVAQQNDDPQDLNIPVSLIQGVFLPIESSDEIGVLSAQMKYFNINAALLGDGAWNDPNQLDQHKRDVNGVIFCSDSFIDETDSATAHVRKTFSEQMKKTPSRFT